jgi:hypothetical protein
VLEVVVAAVGLLLGALDVAATRRIWRSRELERPQQIAQTILVWLLPGAFLAVRYELDPPPEPKNDPTVPRIDDSPTRWGGGGHGTI